MAAKMERQPHISVIQPESAGPTMGAAPTIRPIVPIAPPRRSLGNIQSIIVVTSGTSMPLPSDCTTRPAISTQNAGDIAASAVPTAKHTMEMQKSSFVEKRVMRYAVTGTIIPITRRYTVVSHPASAAVISKVDIMLGSAGVTIVELKEDMNEPIITTTSDMNIFLVSLNFSAIKHPVKQ